MVVLFAAPQVAWVRASLFTRSLSPFHAADLLNLISTSASEIAPPPRSHFPSDPSVCLFRTNPVPLQSNPISPSSNGRCPGQSSLPFLRRARVALCLLACPLTLSSSFCRFQHPLFSSQPTLRRRSLFWSLHLDHSFASVKCSVFCLFLLFPSFDGRSL